MLGKIIGVYMGRPIEGWEHERIIKELGEVRFYCHDHFKVPLIVTDDDISGTFAFVRALEDHGTGRNLTAGQIGKTWLNYLIEKKTVLWWGGMGNSTEHTAYLRLKRGIPAPRSGSMELNTRVVAEQIGAQIFIDAWAMVCPGGPHQAADFARKAASVSHDGEAIHAATVIAAMESAAFIERDLQSLYETALRFIPTTSVIYRMIQELRSLRQNQDDWRAAFAWLKERYGYDKFGGNCHVVPNHGIIHIGLLWGGDDFQQSLAVTCTCGWDVDCNAANVGCLMGIKNGLAGIDAGDDFRTPIADRLFVPTADGGRSITDALSQAYWIVNQGRVLAGQKPISPKSGAKYHFELPGSVQGFAVTSAGAESAASLENVKGHSQTGDRALAIRCSRLAAGQPIRVLTPTFIQPGELTSGQYGMLACPTLYGGQTVKARVAADPSNSTPLQCRLLIVHYDEKDALQSVTGPGVELQPGATQMLEWKVPDIRGMPIVHAGIEIQSTSNTCGIVYLDSLDWTGEPALTLSPATSSSSEAWQKSWVDAADLLQWGPHSPRLIQNEGRGLAIYGTCDWRNYQVRATLTPHMLSCAGLAVRFQGLRRYYALLMRPGIVQLVKLRDESEIVLKQISLVWEFTQSYDLQVTVSEKTLTASIDGQPVLAAEDADHAFESGGIALICDQGRCGIGPITINPA